MFGQKVVTKCIRRGVRAFSSEQSVAIQNLVKGYSIEVTPTGAKKINDWVAVPGLAPNQDINVTYLAGSDVQDTYDTCRTLKNASMQPIPHLPARAFAKIKDVEAFLDVLKNDIGVNEVLVLGGGADNAIGDVGDTMQVLESGLLQKYGFEKVGVAAHPEGHPDIPADVHSFETFINFQFQNVFK